MSIERYLIITYEMILEVDSSLIYLKIDKLDYEMWYGKQAPSNTNRTLLSVTSSTDNISTITIIEWQKPIGCISESTVESFLEAFFGMAKTLKLLTQCNCFSLAQV